MGLNDKGLPAVQFFDNADKRRQIIGLSANANPQVLLLDKDGKISAEFNVSEDGLPKLLFDLSTRCRPSVNSLASKPAAIRVLNSSA